MINLFDERFLYYVEWAIIIQLVIVALLVISAYGAKLYLYFYHKSRNRRCKNIEQQLRHIAEGKEKLSDALTKLCYRNFQDAIVITIKLDKIYETSSWEHAKSSLTKSVFLPWARRYTHSRNWHKNYLATQAYMFSLPSEDDDNLIKLVKSPVLLVALNTAEVIVKFPSQKLIDAVIDHFSATRHIRQNSYAQILSSHAPQIDDYFINRLNHENDPYIKAFCYRMLTYLPVGGSECIQALTDANSDVTELSAAAMKYFPHLTDQRGKVIDILLKKINSETWQIKKTAIGVLGWMKIEKSAEAIAECLSDQEWWVRVKAAQALSRLGKKGILLLQQQDPDSDKFAFEAADQVLKTLDLSKAE